MDETYVVILDMGNERNFRREVLGARGSKEAAIEAIKDYVEGQNRELRELWAGSTKQHLDGRLLKLRGDGLGAQNGFKDCHVWATTLKYSEPLG